MCNFKKNIISLIKPCAPEIRNLLILRLNRSIEWDRLGHRGAVEDTLNDLLAFDLLSLEHFGRNVNIDSSWPIK